jgi:hypothetical protein
MTGIGCSARLSTSNRSRPGFWRRARDASVLCLWAAQQCREAPCVWDIQDALQTLAARHLAFRLCPRQPRQAFHRIWTRPICVRWLQVLFQVACSDGVCL